MKTPLTGKLPPKAHHGTSQGLTGTQSIGFLIPLLGFFHESIADPLGAVEGNIALMVIVVVGAGGVGCSSSTCRSLSLDFKGVLHKEFQPPQGRIILQSV